MSLFVFSRSGVQYRDTKRGEGIALFVPSRDQVRRFNDIGNINAKSVKERYGDLGQTPLWRLDGNSVIVYGLLPDELGESRQSVEVYLPEDYVPLGTSVYYYIFGNRWLVHGIRTVTDEGVEIWHSSKIDAGNQKVVEAVVSSVSERLVEGARENICIAAHTDAETMAKLQEAIKPLGLEVVKFESLTRPKDVVPLYVHRDQSLLFLLAAMVAMMLFLGSVIYAAKGMLDLNNLDRTLADLENKIKSNQNIGRLSDIKNPQDILNVMAKPMKQRPSSVLHAAAEVATVFGGLQQVILDTTKVATQRKTVQGENGQPTMVTERVANVDTRLKVDSDPLLVDQESVAKSALNTRPWIRSIERPRSGGSGDNMELEIGVMIEE